MAQRYFVDAVPGPGPAELPGELAHHLGTVLRVRPGDRVRLADGRGNSALATVTRSERRAVAVEVGVTESKPAPARRIHLAFAPPRQARAEWLFEHGTEVGVAVFWPLLTDRTRPQGERAERWRKLVVAAAGQCDRDWLPEIRPPLALDDFLARADLPPDRFVAAVDGAQPATIAAGDERLLLVGPEGGFTPAERAAAIARGFRPLGLGPHVLRTETAALVGAAVLLLAAG